MKENVFGKVLKKKRIAAGYSQDILAVRSKLNRSYISMLERGIRSPSLDTLLRIAYALNISCVEMIKEIEELCYGYSPGATANA